VSNAAPEPEAQEPGPGDALAESRGGPGGLALGAAAVTVLLLLLGLQAVLRADGTETTLVQPRLTPAPDGASPADLPTFSEASEPAVAVAAPTASPLPPGRLIAPPPSLGTPGPAPAPSLRPPPTPAPTVGQSPSGPRQPTAADANAFLASHPPARGPQRDGAPRSLVADLNGDGANEVLVASLRDGSGMLEVASWDGTAYRLVFASTLGSAQRLLELTAPDLVGDARPEVAVRTGIGTDPAQGRIGPTGERLALFGSIGDRFGPSTGVGGCWDRSFVYGATGAVVDGAELRATCPPDPATGAPRTDVYVFDGAAWTFSRTESA